jgi:hypothetical protein
MARWAEEVMLPTSQDLEKVQTPERRSALPPIAYRLRTPKTTEPAKLTTRLTLSAINPM